MSELSELQHLGGYLVRQADRQAGRCAVFFSGMNQGRPSVCGSLPTLRLNDLLEGLGFPQLYLVLAHGRDRESASISTSGAGPRPTSRGLHVKN